MEVPSLLEDDTSTYTMLQCVLLTRCQIEMLLILAQSQRVQAGVDDKIFPDFQLVQSLRKGVIMPSRTT